MCTKKSKKNKRSKSFRSNGRYEYDLMGIYFEGLFNSLNILVVEIPTEVETPHSEDLFGIPLGQRTVDTHFPYLHLIPIPT